MYEYVIKYNGQILENNNNYLNEMVQCTYEYDDINTHLRI